MSKRLQVVFDDEEYGAMQRVARRRRMSMSEWVRHTLRRARRSEPATDAGRKLEVVRTATGHAFPTTGIDQMLRQIESGYLSEETGLAG